MRCDSHVHIIGPLARYPQHKARAYLAGVAELGTLRRLGQARDISRFVIVQPSFYGSDNTLLLEGLDALGDLGRGVAVVDADHSDEAVLANWARRGVRGTARQSLQRAGHAEAVRQRIFRDGAHRARHELACRGDRADPPADRSGAAHCRRQVPVVIDHYGVFGTATPNSGEGLQLLGLLELPHVWMKLSAPYRVGDNPLQTKPDPKWLKAILASAKDRCVWGSDWPHTPPHEEQKGGDIEAPYRKISYTALGRSFSRRAERYGAGARDHGDNPARLYEYPA